MRTVPPGFNQVLVYFCSHLRRKKGEAACLFQQLRRRVNLELPSAV